MSNVNTTEEGDPHTMTSGQWLILTVLVLLNAAVIALLILALTGQLAL